MSTDDRIKALKARRWRRWFISAAVLSTFGSWTLISQAQMGTTWSAQADKPPRSGPELPIELLALLISFGSLVVSIGGTVTTTIFVWRSDRRANLAENRAQEEHEWKKADREREV